MTSLIEIEKNRNILLPIIYKNFYNSGKLNDLKNINIYTKNGDEFLLIKFMLVEEIISTLNDNFNLLGYDLFPIAVMEWDDIMCLDFRNNQENPQIIYWNYELAFESTEDAITFLFNDFDELYNFLMDN